MKPYVNPLYIGGYVRSYDFTRQNAYNGPGGTGKANQSSFNTAFDLHAQYTLDGFFLGGTYLFADPFNQCATAASHYTKLCNPSATGPAARRYAARFHAQYAL